MGSIKIKSKASEGTIESKRVKTALLLSLAKKSIEEIKWSLKHFL